MKSIQFENVERDKILAKIINQTAIEKGWWENDRSTHSILALVNSELYEAMEADRKNKYTSKYNLDVGMGLMHSVNCSEKVYSTFFENNIKDSVGDELADAKIRLLDALEHYNFDFSTLQENGEIRMRVYFDLGYDFATYIFYMNKHICDYVGDQSLSETIIIGLLMIESFARHLKIDLATHVLLKIHYNINRPYKHGGKKY